MVTPTTQMKSKTYIPHAIAFAVVILLLVVTTLQKNHITTHDSDSHEIHDLVRSDCNRSPALNNSGVPP